MFDLLNLAPILMEVPFLLQDPIRLSFSLQYRSQIPPLKKQRALIALNMIANEGKDRKAQQAKRGKKVELELFNKVNLGCNKITERRGRLHASQRRSRQLLQEAVVSK